MRKIICFLGLFFLLVSAVLIKGGSFYDFMVKDIDGKDYSFSSLKGKTVLIVNTASECGYTPQYQELEELYKKYKDKNFTVIGFPANNFGGQEPGSNEEIKGFCTKNYGVTFPLMGKISVKGEDCHPLYQWLTKKDSNGILDAEVRWNFNKFLVGKDGKLIAHFGSRVKPGSEEITKHISENGK